MSEQEKPIRSVPFEIRSTPYADGEVEYGIFIPHDEQAGAEVGHELDVVVDENKNLRGLIICLHRENSIIEIGSEEEPVPVEMLEQLETETGLLVISIDQDGEVAESYQLNHTPE